MLPDVPTMAQAGLPGYESALWTAFVLPAGAPAPIIERLNSAAVAVLNAPETREALDKQGVEIETGTPEALALRIRIDAAKWRDVIVGAGLKEP
jgi:tripartite-type tricarboxylate transporter receptor subunit TctC